VVEHRQVLSQADRVLQAGNQRGEHDRDAIGRPGHRTGHHQRRGQIALLADVVLRQHHRVQPELIGPADLIHGRLVERLVVRPGRGGPHVVAKGDEGHAVHHRKNCKAARSNGHRLPGHRPGTAGEPADVTTITRTRRSRLETGMTQLPVLLSLRAKL